MVIVYPGFALADPITSSTSDLCVMWMSYC